MNRSLFDIVEDAKDGAWPSHEECYYGLLVLAAVLNLAMTNPGDRVDPIFEAAYKTNPRDFLGDDVPGNPQYDAFRRLGKRILEHVG